MPRFIVLIAFLDIYPSPPWREEGFAFHDSEFIAMACNTASRRILSGQTSILAQLLNFKQPLFSIIFNIWLELLTLLFAFHCRIFWCLIYLTHVLCTPMPPLPSSTYIYEPAGRFNATRAPSFARSVAGPHSSRLSSSLARHHSVCLSSSPHASPSRVSLFTHSLIQFI